MRRAHMRIMTLENLLGHEPHGGAIPWARRSRYSRRRQRDGANPNVGNLLGKISASTDCSSRDERFTDRDRRQPLHLVARPPQSLHFTFQRALRSSSTTWAELWVRAPTASQAELWLARDRGPTSDPRFRAPLYSYGHGSGATTGCAITGGAFYNAPAMPFPVDYAGDYFFADYCSGWIRRYDPANGSVTGFASGAASPVDLTVANDGSLYYLTRGSGGSVFRVTYTASQAPTITTHPSSQTVPAGGTATFTVAASGTPPLSYQWQRNGVDIPGATSASYTLSGVTTADSGATFRCVVSNTAGSPLGPSA